MGDGSMIVMPAPGHLPGSVSMFVRPKGAAPLLLIGDPSYDDRFLNHDRFPQVGDRSRLQAS